MSLAAQEADPSFECDPPRRECRGCRNYQSPMAPNCNGIPANTKPSIGQARPGREDPEGQHKVKATSVDNGNSMSAGSHSLAKSVCVCVCVCEAGGGSTSATLQKRAARLA